MNGTAQNDFSPTLERFVNWAREQGWLYKMVPGHLKHLERFLQRRDVRQLGQVNATLLAEYQRSLSLRWSPATVNGYLSTVCALWRYLLKEEIVVEDATRDLSPLHPDYFIPHLYSASELSQIERATRAAIGQVQEPRQRFSKRTQHAAFLPIA